MGSGSVVIVPDTVEVLRQAAPDPRAAPHMVAMRDGIELATDVYLPDTGSGPWPTVLVRLPYDKNGRYTFMPQVAAYLNAHEFAAVIQDVRGKFGSRGVREPFVHEVDDGWDTLDWVVTQPFSDGTVGMIGDSYYGFTQWAAAASGHPALKAIVPRVTGSRFWDAFGSAEVPRRPFHDWFLGTWASNELYDGAILEQQPGHDGLLVPAWIADMREPWRAFRASVDDGSLGARIFPDGLPAAQLTIPALHTGGWWDNLQRWQLDDWHDSRSAPAAEHQFLRMWATDHEDYLLGPPGTPPADHQTDDEALAAYLPRMLDEPIAFLRHYLGDAATPWQAPKVEVDVVHAGREGFSSWPPAETEPTTLFFTGTSDALSRAAGGELLRQTGDDAVWRWEHDPGDPVPYLAESEFGILRDLPDESSTHARSDVATFTTPAELPLPDLLGPVSVQLLISSEADAADVIARLFEVAPDGCARFLVGGAARVDTSPGVRRVRIRMGDLAFRLRPGYRLRVALSTSLEPLFVADPGTGEDPLSAVDRRRSWQELHLRSDDPCRLDLTTRRRALA